VTVPGISADRNWSRDARPASVRIVEDHAGIATQMARGLQFAGYETSSRGGGRDVPVWPDADAVLLDLGLPDVDGIEVCQQLRAGSDVAVIVATARGEEADRVLALDEGADDYLVKPFGPAERAGLRPAPGRPGPDDPDAQLRPGISSALTGSVRFLNQSQGRCPAGC
jgi:CheY-like chemotaxis protein